MARKSTPEKPPSKKLLKTAGKTLAKPNASKSVKSLAGRVLSEGKKPG
jgi:hypothetical protein